MIDLLTMHGNPNKRLNRLQKTCTYFFFVNFSTAHQSLLLMWNVFFK